MGEKCFFNKNCRRFLQFIYIIVDFYAIYGV